jgi:hypothetical protein
LWDLYAFLRILGSIPQKMQYFKSTKKSYTARSCCTSYITKVIHYDCTYRT